MSQALVTPAAFYTAGLGASLSGRGNSVGERAWMLYGPSKIGPASRA